MGTMPWSNLVVICVAALVALPIPCSAQMQGFSLQSEQVSAKCGEPADVMVTIPAPAADRQITEVRASWSDVSNVASLSEIKIDRMDQGTVRVTGQIRGPDPLPPVPMVSEVPCLRDLGDGRKVPIGVMTSGHGSIYVWYATMPR